MSHRHVGVLFVAATVAVWFAAFAHLSGQSDADQRASRVESALVPGIVVKGLNDRSLRIEDRMRAHHVPGLAVAVINGGVVEWTRGYGVLEAGGRDRVTPHTRFQAASMSKPVAVVGAMTLVQAGRLPLDENVNARLTSWKVPENEFTKTEKVTVRRLMSHTAGLTVHGFGGYEATAPVPSLVQVLDGTSPANSAAVRVDTVPGTLWRYSGGGLSVLQQLVIDVTRQPFADVMRAAVLAPSHMDESGFEQPLPAAWRSTAASGHDEAGKTIAGKYHTYPELAAAGLWTTSGDLARFLIEVQRAAAGRSTLLTAATTKEILRVQKGTFGLGFALSGSGGTLRFSHGGANAGFRGEMVAYAETGQGAVVLTNGEDGTTLANEILRAIAREYRWPGYPGGKEKTLAPVAEAVLRTYVGTYDLAGDIVSVSFERGKLVARVNGTTLELLPESATRFFVLAQEGEVEFEKGANGAVVGLLVNGSTRAARQ